MAVARADVKLMKAEGYLPASEAARAVGVDATTIYRWVQRGLLRAKKSPSGRNRFVAVEDLLDMYESFPSVQKLIRQAAKK